MAWIIEQGVIPVELICHGRTIVYAVLGGCSVTEETLPSTSSLMS